jgi:5-methylcytosine-specific restriction endonuclease McrA
MSPTLRRPCPGCKVVLIASPMRLCAECARAYEAQRGTTAARGYGAAHQAARLRVLRRDGYRCHWCGGVATVADHLVPASKGGPSTDDNLVAACTGCNAERARRRP